MTDPIHNLTSMVHQLAMKRVSDFKIQGIWWLTVLDDRTVYCYCLETPVDRTKYLLQDHQEIS